MYRMTALVGVALCLGLLPMAAPALGAGDYIVVLKDGFSPTRAARRHGAVPTFVYHYALRGYAATLSDAALARAQADPRVLFVTEDGEVSIPEPPASTNESRSLFATGVDTGNTSSSRSGSCVPEMSPGLRLIGGLSSKTADIDCVDERVDVDVVVLDSGISPHADLNIAGGVNCSGGNGYADGLNHGTVVAGIIGMLDDGVRFVGTAPGARLWSVRVLNSQGRGSIAEFVCGVDWVTAHASTIEVANMSVGAKGSDDGNCGRTKKDVLHLAICASVAAGVTYVASAGNDSADASNTIPAAYSEVLAVSAFTETDGLPGGGGPNPPCIKGQGEVDGTFATFSNFGPAIDFAAPGVCEIGTANAGTGVYAWGTGTSFAAPYVTGAVALYRATHPTAPPSEVRAALLAAATAGGLPGDPDGIAEPIVNVRKL